jgi:hypothetical protein
MSSTPLTKMTDQEVFDSITFYGSINKAARALGIPRISFQRRKRLIDESYNVVRQKAPVKLTAPTSGVKTWIFSSAQAHTAVHEEFVANLKAYADYLNAEIHISGFTYNMRYMKAREDKNQDIYHPSISKYISNHAFDVVDKIRFCGEMNTLPTATDPLSGFQAYTREKWGIFPHPKICLESVPVRLTDDPKIIMTTGAVTLPNYLQVKAGLKAEFHHMIAAVIVEVDEFGDFFCRHLVADDDGSFYDLNVYVSDGAASEQSGTVEAITWGDIHTETLDKDVAAGAWGVYKFWDETVVHCNDDSMLDSLRPKYQFFHDLIDFRRRNHHNIKDPHHWFKMHVEGKNDVEGEFRSAAQFLEYTSRDFCSSVVVDSNHDRAFEKWLKTSDYRYDPANAMFFLTAQKRYYEAIMEGEEDFLSAEWAVRAQGFDIENVKFVPVTKSFVVCGSIECALHGDKGANGAKGHIKMFSRMGPKANIADKHGAGIFEGTYLAGHSCERDQGYNRGGLTSWNHSHIVVYVNGKRTIVTMRDGKWRAER